MITPMIPTYFAHGFCKIAANAPGAELKPFPPAYLPIAHSAHPIGSPIIKKLTAYATMNAPPPYCAAKPGNLKKFPNPTALPATAMMTPNRDPHCSFFASDAISLQTRK